MFVIPTAPIGDFTEDALRRMHADAAREYNEALSLAQENPAEVTDDQLGHLEQLLAFTTSIEGHLTALSADTEPVGEPTAPEPTGTDAAERLSALAPTVGLEPGSAPTVADVAGSLQVSQQTSEATDAVLARTAITASAGLSGYTAGHEFATMDELALAMQRRLDGYSGMIGGSSQDVVANFRLPGLTFSVDGDRRDAAVLAELTDERRLPGGSLIAARQQAVEAAGGIDALTASAGWCAPSETDYSARFYAAASGLLDVPTVGAPRGGVWVMPELSFTNIYGTGGANFFALTEAQVAAGTTKTFVEMDCPTPAETRLGVTGFGLVGNLLQLRAFPEYSSAFSRGSLIGLQHFRSARNIATMVTASTAVDLSAVVPWSSDASVLSTVLPAAAMAATDQRYRGRLEPTATIEQVYPLWVLDLFRADFMRRNGVDDPFLADSQIMAYFAARNIAVQFVYGWQDFYTAGGATPGNSTPITTYPATVKFLSYPAGTWVNAINDVITLSTVYDSVRLASNQRIEYFTEQGNAMLQKRTDSRVYTVGVCPSGATGQQHAIACS